MFRCSILLLWFLFYWKKSALTATASEVDDDGSSFTGSSAFAATAWEVDDDDDADAASTAEFQSASSFLYS